MAIYINTNIESQDTQRYLYASQTSMQTSLQRLSTGLRINSAGDDPAGLAIASGMTSQINGMNQAAVNINNGIAFLQTADGAMSTITDNLQRMRVLALQSANGSNSATDRQSLDSELQQLKAVIQQTATTTAFNGISLLDGSSSNLQFQVGASVNDTITIAPVPSMQLAQLGTSGAGSMVTGTSTVAALNAGDLTLNGTAVSASIAGAGAAEDPASAFAIAASINSVTSSSGVSASAITTLTGSAPTTNSAIQDFVINGVTVSTAGAGIANLITAINQAATSENTGITAVQNSNGGVTLTAAAGQDINIELSGTALNSSTANSDRSAFLAATGFSDNAVGTEAAAAVAGIPAIPPVYSHGQITVAGVPGTPYQPPVSAAYATTAGTVILISQDSKGILIGGNSAASAGLPEGLINQNSVTTIPGIATLSALTQEKSVEAVTSIDSAILMVDNARSQLGAYENRFTSAASNVQTESINLTSSRGNVEDANYASETGNLTRASILQKSGTAMLAQANSSASLVMNLLKFT